MLKQWAAGAPVIGAAPVPSGRPKRLFRLTGIRRVERSNFFIWEMRLQIAFFPKTSKTGQTPHFSGSDRKDFPVRKAKMSFWANSPFASMHILNRQY
jgi:hypothetical protein